MLIIKEIFILLNAKILNLKKIVMNIYKKIYLKNWEKLGMHPEIYSGFSNKFNEFLKQIDNESEIFANNIIEDLVNGKVILIKSAFSEDFVKNLKNNVKNF